MRVAKDRSTLLLYLTSAQLPSRNVELVKYGQILTERYSAQGLTVTAIVHGKILDLKNLIDRSLIRYQVIEDQDGRLGGQLGLSPKENGVFFFDSGGICRFSTNANMKAEDLRQLIAAEFLKLHPFDKSIENARPVEKGQTLETRIHIRLLPMRGSTTFLMQRAIESLSSTISSTRNVLSA